MPAETSAPAHKKKRGRSPSYPGIDLEEALQRSRELYKAETKYAAPVGAILSHWGYKGNSGPGLVSLAALKKFGFLVDEGTGLGRKARLSQDAISIVVDTRPESAERDKVLKQAAVSPVIHRNLWAKYGPNLPSDATLRHELITERNFTPAGADEFIPQYKKTLAFAKLTESDMLSENGEDKDSQEQKMTPPTTLQEPPADTKHSARVVQLPISTTEWAALQAPFPITKEKWEQMIRVLEAMKPGLIENGDESAE